MLPGVVWVGLVMLSGVLWVGVSQDRCTQGPSSIPLTGVTPVTATDDE